jgi:hypothetical protein
MLFCVSDIADAGDALVLALPGAGLVCCALEISVSELNSIRMITVRVLFTRTS